MVAIRDVVLLVALFGQVVAGEALQRLFEP
jgi:hypothetical protein